MRIEHIALQMEDPVRAADWYGTHLGFSVRRAGGPPAHARFLADASGHVVLEIYRNPKVPVPDYRTMDPLLLHIAFVSDDVVADCQRLLAAGAARLQDPETLDNGDRIAMVRDPWGVPLQLVTRRDPIL